MFSFNLIQGDIKRVLKDKNTIVISENIAGKYFGKNNPIGKRLSINRSGQIHDFVISGVIENAPENSTIQYSILLPFEKLQDFLDKGYFSNWGLFSVHTFVRLHEPSQAESINAKFPSFIGKYVSESRAKYHLQPLTDVH